MATCGYLCPACEGRGFDENGKDCHWCSFENSSSAEPSVKKAQKVETEKDKDNNKGKK